MSSTLGLVTELNHVLASENLMVTLLLDGSGSVLDQFEELRKLSIELVQMLKAVDVQVLQFSTVAKTECAFTRDQAQIIRALREMKIMGGSTNMEDAFKMTRMSLFRSITAASRPLVFFVTDGQFSGKHPGEEIRQLLAIEPKPVIFGLGIGAGTSVDQLRAIIPAPNTVFHFGNYGQLKEIIKSLTVAEHEEPAIKIAFSQECTTVQKSRANLTLHLTVEPDLPLHTLPSATTIRFLANRFFFAEEILLSKPVKRGEPETVSVTLKIKPNAQHFGEFPEKIWYEATLPGPEMRKYRGSVQVLLGWLGMDFVYEEDPMRDINVLMWGPMGAGKSSFINGTVTLFGSTQKVQKPLTAFRAPDHVTTSYTCVPLRAKLDKSALGMELAKHLRIRFWDVWGLTTSNYTKLNIHHFLEGRVPNGMELVDKSITSPVVPENVIHSVVFVIPIGTSEDAVLLRTLGDNIKTVLRCDIRPVIVVNFITSVKSEADIASSLRTIVDASGLHLSDIHTIDNYEGNCERSMEKDLKYWKIMKAIYEDIPRKLQTTSATYQTDKDNAPQPLFKATPPPSPSPKVARDVGSKLAKCATPGCDNEGKEVASKFCAECGIPPVAPIVKRVCGNPDCEDYGNPVSTKLCGECGQAPKSSEVPAADLASICRKPNCSLFGTKITSKFCPECGDKPSAGAFLDLTSHSNSPPNNTRYTHHSCKDRSCNLYGKLVDPKSSGGRCMYCGKALQM